MNRKEHDGQTDQEEISWVYMLRCSNGSFYTGYAADVAARLRKHFNGTSGAKYVKAFSPVSLAGCWKIYGSRGAGLKAEACIKSFSRKLKEQIIAEPELFVHAAKEKLNIRAEAFPLSSVERKILTQGKENKNWN